MSLPFDKTLLNRRMFFHTAAAAPLTVMLQSFAVPQVDSLTLQIIVDNATFGPFLPDQKLNGLQVIRSQGGSIGNVMS